MIHLILGGARSGKSSYAEACIQDYVSARKGTSHMATSHIGTTRAGNTQTKADSSVKFPHYVATATAFDGEMEARIAHHQTLVVQSGNSRMSN